MASIRPGMPEEERLPWLDERPAAGVAERRPFAIVILVAALLGLAVPGGWWWWTHRSGPAAEDGVRIIAAPPGPYKVRPADPGGMRVEGTGYASFAASEGEEPGGRLDLGAVPEEPLAKRGEPVASPVDPATAAQVQLGAFSTEKKAQDAWAAMAKRFAFLEPLDHVVLPMASGDGTIYRLRAVAGPAARGICGRLRVAGETCILATP